ncbi:MAG: glycine cleavage system protein GcvH [Christensenellales bacterium]
MDFPKGLLYTKTHEWLREDGDTVLIGLTDHAQKELGDLVFINVPFAGDSVTAGESFADVESVKAVSEVISPVSGTVLEVNETLVDTPEKINQAPYEAWIIRVGEIAEKTELLTAQAYEDFLKEA